MDVEQWMGFFEEEKLHTLNRADAEWAVEQTAKHGEDEMKRAARIWHQDNVDLDKYLAGETDHNETEDCWNV